MAEIPGPSKQEIKLFYCYAHEDKALRNELQIGLAGLRRQYQLTNWCDREILPGERWEEVIDLHLSTADVILLLISPYFVDSDYCYGVEMQRALERHHVGGCCVIPILLRPTYWEDSPLGDIQMLPSDARPITSWPDCYEAFHDVASRIGAAIKAMLITRAEMKEEKLEEGNALYNLKRYEEALVSYEQAIRLDPNDSTIYYRKGFALESLERYTEALASYEQAIRLNPNNTPAYYRKGNALNELERYEEALVVYEQVIRLNPNDATTYDNKAFALYNLKRYEEALATCEQVVRLLPNDAVACFNKGDILNELKRFEEALAAYEQAIRLDPNYAQAYKGKGSVLNELKRFEEALTAYEQTICLDPNDAEAYRGKGDALSALAEQAYARARELETRD